MRERESIREGASDGPASKRGARGEAVAVAASGEKLSAGVMGREGRKEGRESGQSVPLLLHPRAALSLWQR